MTRSKGLTDAEKKGHVSFVAVPLVVNGVKLGNPLDSSKYYLDNFVCIYKAKTLIPQLAGKCSSSLTIGGPGTTKYYDVTFKQLKWIQASNEVSFQMSLTTPLNFPIVIDSTKETAGKAPVLKALLISDYSTIAINSTFDSYVGLQSILYKYSPKALQSMSLQELKSLNLGNYIADFSLIDYDNFDVTQISDLQQAFINLFNPIQSRGSSVETSTITVTSSPSYLNVFVLQSLRFLNINNLNRSTSSHLP